MRAQDIEVILMMMKIYRLIISSAIEQQLRNDRFELLKHSVQFQCVVKFNKQKKNCYL